MCGVAGYPLSLTLQADPHAFGKRLSSIRLPAANVSFDFSNLQCLYPANTQGLPAVLSGDTTDFVKPLTYASHLERTLKKNRLQLSNSEL